MIVTYRDDEVDARPAVREFLDVLDRGASVQVHLEPLAQSDVARQVQDIVGAPVSPEEAARIHRRSGGVPLLVEEILAARAAGTTGIPHHLRELFLARVRRLDPRALRAVEVVAVAGDRCADQIVADVLRVERADTTAALERAAAVDILVPDGSGYRMRHDLLREAVYGNLPPGRRRRLHARVASALDASPQRDIAASAHHWYEADDPACAALANLKAAELAERVHAPVEVHAFLHRVLQHADALPAERLAAAGGRPGLLARAAEAAYLGGAFERATALSRECVAETGDPVELAARLERLARYCWVSRDGGGAQHAHERSVAVLPADAPTTVRVRVLAGYAWYLAMSLRAPEALRWSDRALEAADVAGRPIDRCRALLAWGLARASEEEGLAALWEARHHAVRCDAADELGRAYAALELSLRDHGHTAARERMLREGIGFARTYGLLRSYGSVVTYLLSELLLDLGRWDEAADLLDEAAAGPEDTDLPATFAHAFLARLAAGRGDRDAARTHAERTAAVSGSLPQQQVPMCVALCALAESSLWSGEAAEAAALAVRAAAVTSEPLYVAEAVAFHARALADLAERARLRGLPAPDEPALAEAAPDAVGVRNPKTTALYTAALAEESRQRGHHPEPWRRAVAAWDTAGDPYRAAYSRWRLGDALLATRPGRPEAARELDAAHRTAVRLGAQPLLDAVRSLAGVARIRLGEEGRGGGSAAELGLTHRELEIVSLVAAGRTNAEIAQALVISPRTVGVHVSSILRKLGATRRTEAADIARRRGLVTR